MVLALAIHTVSTQVSAKVPFSMISLMDHVRKKDLPPELKCRQVFPTSGLRSTSLWDATDLEVLQLWLDEFLDAECTNEVFEVQEQFAFGISAELTRLRTAEKVTANTRATAAAVGERTRTAAAVASQQMNDLDAKYGVSQQAASAMQAAKEASLTASKNLASGIGQVHARAMQNQRISAAATQLNAGWKRLGSNLPFLGRSPASSETDSPRPSASSAAPSATMGNANGPANPQAPEKQSAKPSSSSSAAVGTPAPPQPAPAKAASPSRPAASKAAPDPSAKPPLPSGTAGHAPAQQVAPQQPPTKKDLFTLDDNDGL
ncbi:g3366 [Coccomyxa viridis]|uniref:G3366 protein n=1 Tax=Coccomyxa viridis TaxID=1274662 RepID=A0ABP1FP85_9CHLO